MRTVRIPASVSQIGAALWLGALVGCGTLHAGLDDPAPPRPPTGYVAGELIIQLRPAAGQILDEALKAAQPPTATGLAWLDDLNRRYDVTRIEPVFAHQPDLEAIKRKYPQRTRRATPGATAPILAYTYTLTLSLHADILWAAQDYSAHPAVEYAAPNYLAVTQ